MNVRLLPYEVADGPRNMAADEVLLQTAAVQNIASFRFYGWSSATVSLGYFEEAASRSRHPKLAQLPWVRRPTGGGTLVHHHEVTYALALPPKTLWRLAPPSIAGMHAIISTALAGFGASGLLLHRGGKSPSLGQLCFEKLTDGDLTCEGRKIVGSAQRKHRGALLQHGGVLLAQSEYTPTLPGLRELAGVMLSAAQVETTVTQEFARATGWFVQPEKWNVEERQHIEELAVSKYSSQAWNEKR